VLGVEPARAQSELDPAAAHHVRLRDLDREDAGEAERHRSYERAEPNRLRFAAERRERGPGVGRAGTAAPAHVEVVVGTEERIEAELLGEPGDGEQLFVRRTLLRLGEDAEFHGERRYSHVFVRAWCRPRVVTLPLCSPSIIGPT
jgi:hypothetical protein